MTKETDQTNDEKLTYEAARSELAKIVSELESAELNLEKSLKLFARAKELAKFCEEFLENAQKQL